MTELIVSIQGYSEHVTQALIDIVMNNGAAGVRTDKDSVCSGVHIGLKKNDNQYYITTDMNDLIEVSKWTDLIAIDSRKGNKDIEKLYQYCEMNNIKIVADISDDKDLIALHKLCQAKKIKYPEFVATTFSNQNDLLPDVALIEKIKCLFPKSKVIAEGGYIDFIRYAIKYGADYICIGHGLTDLGFMIKEITEALKYGK